jgi:hypothetical protein
MTIIASVNLNKRFNSSDTRGQFGRWLIKYGVDIVLVQEPWKTPSTSLLGFGDFISIGGNHRVFSWISSQLKIPNTYLIGDFCQRLEIGYMVIYNVYLDAYERQRRADQLEEIRQYLVSDGDRPVLMMGDFNIAPELDDGLVNGVASKFNSEIDRGSLRYIIKTCNLIDAGRNINTPEWTIERKIDDRKVQFRCDLALVSDYMADKIKLQVDHTTRIGTESFTDHSGLLATIPVTMENADIQATLFSFDMPNDALRSKYEFKPEKTAIHRRGPSSPAKILEKFIREVGCKSILDYGCGYGEDVKFYRSIGLMAEGYDPYAPFGWNKKPLGTFDLVTVTFVLNVLPNSWERLQVVQKAAKHVSDNGFLVVTSRSPMEIAREASTKSWKPFNDGYWSHEGRGTFQHGLSTEEIIVLATRVGFSMSSLTQRIATLTSATCVILEREISKSDK